MSEILDLHKPSPKSNHAKTSFILAIVSLGLSFLFVIFLYYYMINSEIFLWEISLFLLLLMPLFSIIGFIKGIQAMRQREKKKFHLAFGLLGNGFVLLFLISIIALTLSVVLGYFRIYG